MKACFQTIFALSVTLSLVCHAQDIPPGFVLLHESGLHTENLDALVDAADVIMEGRYGEVISNDLSYGENNSKEGRMRDLGLSEEEVTKLALPVKRYELLVDRVLKADAEVPDVLVLQLVEDPDAVQIFPYLLEQRRGQHLFFLTLNGDGTVSLNGRVFDLKLIGNDAYYFVGSKEIEAFPDENFQSVVNRVERSILR